MEKRKRWETSAAIRWMGQGNKAARACTSAAVLVPLQSIFGCGRHSSPQAAAATLEGASWCVTHTSTTNSISLVLWLASVGVFFVHLEHMFVETCSTPSDCTTMPGCRESSRSPDATGRGWTAVLKDYLC